MTNEVMINASDRDATSVSGTWTAGLIYTGSRYNAYSQSQNGSASETFWTRYFPKSGTYRVKFVYVTDSDASGTVNLGLDTSTNDIFPALDQTNGGTSWNVVSFTTNEIARGSHKITFTTTDRGFLTFLQFDLIDEHDVLGEDAPSEDKPFWEDLGAVYHTGAAATSMTTGEFPAKKYLKVFVFSAEKPSGNNTYLKCNNSTGSDYSFRGNGNGGTDSTTSMQNRAEGFLTNLDPSGSGTVTGLFAVYDIINKLDEEKLCICHSASGWTNAGV